MEREGINVKGEWNDEVLQWELKGEKNRAESDAGRGGVGVSALALAASRGHHLKRREAVDAAAHVCVKLGHALKPI